MTVTTAETAVRDLLEEHAAAMREKDADRLAACHRPGAVVYDLAPPLAGTFDRERTRAWFAGKAGGSPASSTSTSSCGSAPRWCCGRPAGAGRSCTRTSRRRSTWTARFGRRST